MFDIGWTELVVVAIVAILVVGPKDLPGMLRGFGKTIGSLKKMARDFQRQFDDALKEAELDEVRKSINKPMERLDDARKSMQEFQEKAAKTLKDPVEMAQGASAPDDADRKPADPTDGKAGARPAQAKQDAKPAPAKPGKTSAAVSPSPADKTAGKTAPGRKKATAKRTAAGSGKASAKAGSGTRRKADGTTGAKT